MNFGNPIIRRWAFAIGMLSAPVLLNAQSGASTTAPYWLDSSVIPAKRMPQHTEFVNNMYPFPAKPRNQWEIGIKAGAVGIAGDVRNRYPGFGAGLHVRKALGYVLSLRGEVGFGTTKGLDFRPSMSYGRNSAWSAYTTGGNPTTPVFYNYKTTMYDASIQLVAAINNIRFHRHENMFSLYGFVGIGGMIWDNKVDALDGAGGTYTAGFNSVIAQYGSTGYQYKDRKAIKKALKGFMDGKYETAGETDSARGKLFGKPFTPVFVTGLGVQFKLSKKLSLSIEDKISFTTTDLLEGQQWQNNATDMGGGAYTLPASSRYYDMANFLSVGLNLSIGRKAVEPLWWLNPLSYAYNEINSPKHMRLPKPVLDDNDGDGVTNQFDMEPNTPSGAPVDSHGVSRDTDGDGVPDYRDRELITPTQCQPVDANGVGKCPPPSCCDSITSLMTKWQTQCNIGELPDITFIRKSNVLSNDQKAVLAGVAQRLRDNSFCKIAVTGYSSQMKNVQQLSWERVNAVINYLVEKEGIGTDRLIFKYSQQMGNPNIIKLRNATGEQGPNTVPPPFPHLRGGK
ncbi:MAG: hypothetical protein QM731_06455 [Chitinophagaceae bacterium]